MQADEHAVVFDGADGAMGSAPSKFAQTRPSSVFVCTDDEGADPNF